MSEIECIWPASDFGAPTWERWEQARPAHATKPGLASHVALSFMEELHAIEAVVAGQGAAICNDILVGAELANGRLVPISCK